MKGFFHQLALTSLTFLLFIASTPNLSADSSLDSKLNSNNDHGFWLNEEVSINLGSNWSAICNIEQRWGADYRLFWYQRYEAIFHYDLTQDMNYFLNLCPDSIFKRLSWGIGYAQLDRIQKNTRGIFHWVGISRPEIEVEIDLKWNGWSLKQRFRGEYRQYNASHYKSFGDFRWRLLLKLPWSFTCWKITPYINNEFFFRENTYSTAHPNGLVGGLYEDRFRIGLTANPIEGLMRTDVFWQWRPVKQTPGTHPRWFNGYHFGMNVALMF